MDPEKKIAKLERLLTLVDESLTREEFTKAFEEILNVVVKTQTKNKEEIEEMWKVYENMCVSMKEKSATDLEALKKKVTDYCTKEMGGMMKEHEEAMSAIEDKLTTVRDGKDADEEQIVKDVLAQIPPPLPEVTPEQVRDKLETLKDDERLDKSAIKGLQEEIKELKEMISKVGSARVAMGGPNANAVQSYDLSSQLNGVAKSFQVPRHRVAIMLVGTQAPLIYRPTTDYTTANVTLTLTSEVLAPATGQSLIFMYLK